MDESLSSWMCFNFVLLKDWISRRRSLHGSTEIHLYFGALIFRFSDSERAGMSLGGGGGAFASFLLIGTEDIGGGGGFLLTGSGGGMDEVGLLFEEGRGGGGGIEEGVALLRLDFPWLTGSFCFGCLIELTGLLVSASLFLVFFSSECWFISD